jgi:membrane protein DedA with SNARE-associated domain
VLIAAAIYAGAGKLNIVVVGVIGFLAAVLGDNLGFAIGHFGGRRLVLRLGRYVLLTPARLDTAERFFTRHGGKIVTIARFVEGLRQNQRDHRRHHRHALATLPGLQRPGRRPVGRSVGRTW